MIVVSDTSPLNYLLLIGAIEVTPQLFSEIYAPPVVLTEMQHPRAPDIVRLWAVTPPLWLQVRAPATLLPATSSLDLGETHALSLAKELSAAALLIDERKGRRIAQQEGLVTIGTITILELAAEKKLLDLPAMLTKLQGTSFQISPEILAAALQRHATRQAAPPLASP